VSLRFRNHGDLSTLRSAGTYKLSGDLVGDWAINSFTELATTPVYRGEGTEKFNGCLDRDHDGSCRGEPSGKLKFSYEYWGKFADDDSLELQTCSHTVTGGRETSPRRRAS
jgi:hypothetical protein